MKAKKKASKKKAKELKEENNNEDNDAIDAFQNKMEKTYFDLSDNQENIKDFIWIFSSALSFIKWLRNEETLKDIRTYRAWRSTTGMILGSSYSLTQDEIGSVFQKINSYSIELTNLYFETYDKPDLFFRPFAKFLFCHLNPEATGDLALCLLLFLKIARVNNDPEIIKYEKDINDICIAQLDCGNIYEKLLENIEEIYPKFSAHISDELSAVA